MCQLCNDLDEYDARHGHQCDEHCIATCEECGSHVCKEDDQTSVFQAGPGEVYYFCSEATCQTKWEAKGQDSVERERQL